MMQVITISITFIVYIFIYKKNTGDSKTTKKYIKLHISKIPSVRILFCEILGNYRFEA